MKLNSIVMVLLGTVLVPSAFAADKTTTGRKPSSALTCGTAAYDVQKAKDEAAIEHGNNCKVQGSPQTEETSDQFHQTYKVVLDCDGTQVVYQVESNIMTLQGNNGTSRQSCNVNISLAGFANPHN